MKETIVHIENHKLRNPAAVTVLLNQLKDGKYLLTFKAHKKRSDNQNRYWWGCVIPLVKQGLNDCGYNEIRTNEDAHEVIKGVFLKRSIVSEKTGEVIEFSGSTADLQTVEFNKLIEDVVQWAVEFLSIQIPMPNESMVMFND